MNTIKIFLLIFFTLFIFSLGLNIGDMPNRNKTIKLELDIAESRRRENILLILQRLDTAESRRREEGLYRLHQLSNYEVDVLTGITKERTP